MYQAALFPAAPASAPLAHPPTASPEADTPRSARRPRPATSLLAGIRTAPATGTHPAGTVQGIAIPTLSIHQACSTEQHDEARALVKRMYSWRGYRVATGIPPANGVTLLARHDDQPVGTLTVGLDSPVGLSCSTLYPEEIARLRAQGARLCEFTRLAVDQGKGSTEILARLFHVAFIYARQLRGATDLMIEVNPRHQAYYQQLMGFQQAGPLRTCPRVDAPAVLLRLPLRHAEAQLQRFGEGPTLLDSVRSLYPYCFSRPEARQIAKRLRAAN